MPLIAQGISLRVVGRCASEGITPSCGNICQVFNIGADTPYSVNRLAQEISTAMGEADYPLKYEPARLEVVNAVASHEKVRRIFSPPATVDLAVGLKRTVDCTTAATAGRICANVGVKVI
ncbi:hypothetical protein Pmar_PMAR015931 [Perkinsus marinus ATCC 50983]|uniref:Uncharacterized protein n=1 Tax=Perkinsus marinus (strain ATCC 50983 / TXsc) TaxID=423536 RepID=C5L446_PERM5|nr:hypothetical protein Pmar_PMAR015931 [Perkinsus marinus ATCC 50983]EER08512.1 hypothetical protein Pmar_PMAR015931 [Perkinsus marinus ATCC 50983]|eukprot:XP_002776696.1 hypothetical protein Pmar_PMAR015931 [Perkinsus marinus ATCC 50983]